MIRRRFIQLAVAVLGLSGIRAKAQGNQRLVSIEKYRPCDGSCCHKAPLRKTWRGGKLDCMFHNHALKYDIGGCDLMLHGEWLEMLTLKELLKFAKNCLGFPQLFGPYSLGEVDEGICCHRNVETNA